LRKSQWALNWIDPDGKKEESLVDEWGMTKEEAQKDIGEKRSSASLILYGVKGNPVGILYVESPSETAFGNPADQATLEKQILQTATVQQLIGALDIINKEIMAGPRIHIFDTAQTGNR
jgi:ParB-like chromosome segregation protein Spo0J